jgi:hypothetical protein
VLLAGAQAGRFLLFMRMRQPNAGGVMKRSALILTLLCLAAPLAAVGATLENTDSREYEFLIVEVGRSYGSQYRILEHSKVDMCFYGCELTMLDSGQRLWINQRDEAVIDDGVIKMRRGASVRGGW